MTTRSRPGRGETGKKLSKGSQAISVAREETGGSTQRMGGRAKDVRTFPTIYRNISRWPKPSELLSIDAHTL